MAAPSPAVAAPIPAAATAGDAGCGAAAQEMAVAASAGSARLEGVPRPAARCQRRQLALVEALTAPTTARTAGSKRLTRSEHRAVLADPRAVAGFRPDWKEMVYPIVCDRAAGLPGSGTSTATSTSTCVNGFGRHLFGHRPDFVARGRPRSSSAGLRHRAAVATWPARSPSCFCELTGNERVTFCNTGSEAVMAAMRLARTVTGRDRSCAFAGAYHGSFDEVLVRGVRAGETRRALPAAPA